MAIRYPGGDVGGTGHTGIIISGEDGNLSNMSAHADGVYTTDNQFGERDSTTPDNTLYLRYIGN